MAKRQSLGENAQYFNILIFNIFFASCEKSFILMEVAFDYHFPLSAFKISPHGPHYTPSHEYLGFALASGNGIL